MIKFSWSDQPDALTLHARYPYEIEPDPYSDGIVFTLSNDRTPIYQVKLGWGDLIGRPGGRAFKFIDNYAKALGEGSPSGGISRLRVLLKLYEGVPYVSFKIKAYGDFSDATLPDMTAEFSTGVAAGSLTATWDAEPAKWIVYDKVF
jgi:hypothetical protein